MKCSKCGYDWSNSGDSAHVCGPVKVMQQEHGEPVAIYQFQNSDGSWIDQAKHSYDYNVKHGHATVRVVYTTPQQCTWVGLTDEEINSVRYKRDWTAPWTDTTFARAIEAKLREKNSL